MEFINGLYSWSLVPQTCVPPKILIGTEFARDDRNEFRRVGGCRLYRYFSISFCEGAWLSSFLGIVLCRRLF